MDQVPRGDDGLANGNLFGDSQHFNYESIFHQGNDQSFNDAGWGLNASNYPSLSRAPSSQPAPSWPTPGAAAHLSASTTPNNFHHNPADIYGRSPLHSPAPFAQNQPYAGYGGQNFAYQQPYNQPLQQQNLNHGFQNYGNATVNPATIAPGALNPNNNYQVPISAVPTNFNRASSAQQAYTAQPMPVANSRALIENLPAGDQSGRFMTIDFSKLVKATNTERAAAFANIGKEPQEFPVNRATVLPAYQKRSSRNELKKQVRNDPKLRAKLDQKSWSMASPRPGFNPGSPTNSVQSGGATKYDEESDSESDSSEGSEVSLYSDEEDDSAGAPLPSKRPDESPKAAVEYDTIKALWRSKRKSIDAVSIRKGLGDFWDIIKTIRDRWKTDTKAVEEAEEKKRIKDLDLLKGRVKDQRDMMETAFKAALKHGFKSIVELFSENTSLLFLCYQFLLDRFKAEDLNGLLARSILEILSLSTSNTSEKLEKTHLGKIVPRYAKTGDAKTKFYAKKIIDNAAAGSRNAKPATPKTEPEATAGVKRSSTTAGNAPATTATKKPAVAAPKTNGTPVPAKPTTAVKKPAPATQATKTGATTTAAPATKTKTVTAKPSGFFNLQSAGKKPGTSNLEKTVPRPAEKKPATAAPAKPAFNLAETLANLAKPKEEPKKPEPKQEVGRSEPAEPPERKAKRAARLARGASAVRWKDSTDLVEIRYFTHDPEEELDHDASQMRDVKDVGGEGRMLKQHQDMMDVDEEDEPAEDDKFVPFKTPSLIDFSTVDEDERSRNYAPYGGGKTQPESPESAIRKEYEASSLMAVYSSPIDVPPNPREPVDPYNGEDLGQMRHFSDPPDRFATRAQQKGQQKAAQNFMQSVPNHGGQPGQDPGIDLSSLTAFMSKQQQQPPQAQQPNMTAPTAIPPNLQDILKQLGSGNQQQPAPAPTAPPIQNQAFPNFSPQQPFNFGGPAAPQQSSEPDISAILAALQQNTSAPQTTNKPPFAFPTFPQPDTTTSTSKPHTSGKKRHAPPDSNPFYKTKVCKYWQDGKCKKGAECSYLHE